MIETVVFAASIVASIVVLGVAFILLSVGFLKCLLYVL